MIIILLGILLALYCSLMLIYRLAWHRPSLALESTFVPNTSISVIIAARNEAQNIDRCMKSLLAQQYPAELLEIIVVDDCSTDNTLALLKAINARQLRIIEMAPLLQPGQASYKKEALSTGIAHSTGQLIVTTDADCWTGPQWLATLAQYYQAYQPQMIVAPVAFVYNNSILQKFQAIDFMTMQGITLATVQLRIGIMANGANLTFTRQAYNAVGGYQGISHIISGDDYLLQMKIKQQFPKGIHYLRHPQALVHTLPQPTWSAFLQQRIRWASKTGKYPDTLTTIILGIVYLLNFIFAVSVISLLWAPQYSIYLLIALLVKTIAELILLLPVAHFFAQRRLLLIFPILQPLHIIYIIIAGFLSQISTFEWKNRNIKQA